MTRTMRRAANPFRPYCWQQRPPPGLRHGLRGTGAGCAYGLPNSRVKMFVSPRPPSVRAPAIQCIVGHGEELPTRDILFALDGNVGQFAFGPFHYRKQRLVVTVDILAEFELATVIYESVW